MPNNHTRPVLGSLIVFLLLAVLHTWPLAAAPAHWSRVDLGDGALNTSHCWRDRSRATTTR